MNQHQRIMGEIERQYEGLQDAVFISPAALAHRVFEAFSTGEEELHVQYTSLEHLKQMARGYLRKTKDTDAEMSVSYVQNEFDLGVEFSGKLQDRYPIPRGEGEEPSYKRRQDLTPEERQYNVSALRKSARSRMEHADALEAEGLVSGAAA